MFEQITTSNPFDRFQPVGKFSCHHVRDGHQEEPVNKSIFLEKLREASTPTACETIKKQLSFLKPYYDSIHSLVLVGSTAYNMYTEGSDIDIVIITSLKGHDEVCEVIFEKEINDSLQDQCPSNFEYTVLTSANTEELFQLSSPFAFSIRHGVVIRDDGFLFQLRNKKIPRIPHEKYYATCLYEHIATPYFGLLKKYQAETKRKGCSLTCPKKTRNCQGLGSATVFAKLILRMLYVTLPSRGMVPLTKNDAIAYARIVYGNKGEKVAQNVVNLLRGNRSSFCFDEFKPLKDFAVQLYKEILTITGLSRDVLDIIQDAARIAKKDFTAISNPAVKNCVM